MFIWTCTIGDCLPRNYVPQRKQDEEDLSTQNRDEMLMLKAILMWTIPQGIIGRQSRYVCDCLTTLCDLGFRAWNNSRWPIKDLQEIAYDRRKSRVSNLKKQGKSWLPITMIGNSGNLISSPEALRMRVDSHALLRGTFQSLDERNKSLTNVPTAF
jgi:hypothetical protein